MNETMVGELPLPAMLLELSFSWAHTLEHENMRSGVRRVGFISNAHFIKEMLAIGGVLEFFFIIC